VAVVSGRRRASLGPVLFVLLLAAALASAALVVRAKTPDLMVEVTKLPGEIHRPFTGERIKHGFSPDGDGRRDVAHIALFIRADEPHATIELIDSSGEVVRTLAPDVPLRADQRIQLTWNGRTDQGLPAPTGPYQLRVVLPGLDREAVDPRHIVIVRR
jgi:hypothetical protein